MHIYFNCKTKLILKDIQFKARSKFSLCTKKRDVYLLGTESSFRLVTVYVQINCTCKIKANMYRRVFNIGFQGK